MFWDTGVGDVFTFGGAVSDRPMNAVGKPSLKRNVAICWKRFTLAKGKLTPFG